MREYPSGSRGMSVDPAQQLPKKENGPAHESGIVAGSCWRWPLRWAENRRTTPRPVPLTTGGERPPGRLKARKPIPLPERPKEEKAEVGERGAVYGKQAGTL